MSQISTIFNRYINFTNEVNVTKDSQKEDKKNLDEELKELGISGARKKAFLKLVQEETMSDKQRNTLEEVENEMAYLRDEIRK